MSYMKAHKGGIKVNLHYDPPCKNPGYATASTICKNMLFSSISFALLYLKYFLTQECIQSALAFIIPLLLHLKTLKICKC